MVMNRCGRRLPSTPTRALLLLLLVLAMLLTVASGRLQAQAQHQTERRLDDVDNANDDNNANANNNNNSNKNSGTNLQQLETCDDLIVQVTSIQTYCDSPQTFYYGSGVHRNSLYCAVGDKATTTVTFDVTEALNTNIYVVLSVYAGYGNDILTSTSPKNLQKYVGYQCNQAGSYQFTYTTTLGTSSSYSNYGSFVPYHQIAFSSETNGDYNLGAANIPCHQWEDSHEWAMVTAQSTFTTRDFVIEYGILISTLVVVSVFVAVFTRQRLQQLKARNLKQVGATTTTVEDDNNNSKRDALIAKQPPPTTTG